VEKGPTMSEGETQLFPDCRHVGGPGGFCTQKATPVDSHWDPCCLEASTLVLLGLGLTRLLPSSQDKLGAKQPESLNETSWS
jgi:hypothetical protein